MDNSTQPISAVEEMTRPQIIGSIEATRRGDLALYKRRLYYASDADAFMDHQAALLAQKDAEIARLLDESAKDFNSCEDQLTAKDAELKAEKELREKAETQRDALLREINQKLLPELSTLRKRVEELEEDLSRGMNVAHQRTKCCVCGIYKHTPVRNDDLGGYICGGCLEKAYEQERTNYLSAESALATLKEESQWVDVRWRMPENRIRVLAWDGTLTADCFYGVRSSVAAEDVADWRDTNTESRVRYPITHWRPLPSPPTTEGNS